MTIEEDYDNKAIKNNKRRAKFLNKRFERTKEYRGSASSLEKYEQEQAWKKYKKLKKVRRKKDYIRE